MANQNLDLDRDKILSLLARKIGCERKNVDFLFRKHPPIDDNLKIPSFRDKISNSFR